MKILSFVVRTFNEEKYIGKLIDNLNSQVNTNYKLEIVVVDSSTDKTPKIARDKKAIVIDLPRSKFNYASALNMGIKKSNGDLIVIMSAHAIPVNNDWLYRMTSHFKNKKVAGVYCRQIPWPDAEWREKYRLNRTFNKDTIYFNKDLVTDEMSFSNAASCIKRSVWEKHNFSLQPASEDREWSLWAIDNDYTIVYDADAVIYHSHNESPRIIAKKGIELAINYDIIHGRKRDLFSTFKNVAGGFIHDLFLIFFSGYCKNKKIISIYQSIICSYWFIADFKKVQKITLDNISKSSK